MFLATNEMAILLLVVLTVGLLIVQCSAAVFNGFDKIDAFDVVEESTKTSSGNLVGDMFETDDGDPIQSWTNIHYAKPKNGIRHSPPEMFYAWSEYVNVKSPTHEPCLQYNFLEPLDDRVIGKEQYCNTLSVFRYLGVYFDHDALRRRTHDVWKRLGNVIVLLRPGTFMYDFPFDARKFAGSMCCEYLITVVVNYRLGPLGFLSGFEEDDTVPPNVGLLDQIAALNWVNKNIAAFLGDPEKVTLVGVGAGAAAVELHMMSKRSKGLFNKAVSLGGSALVPWAIARNGPANTRQYARILNCTDDIPLAMMDCLRAKAKDPFNAVHKMSELYTWLNIPLSPLGPVVDYDLIEDEPLILLRSGAFRRMPWLVSFTDGAGLVPGARVIGSEGGLHGINTQYDLLSPFILDYKSTMDSRLQEDFGYDTLKAYFGDNRTSRNSAGLHHKLDKAQEHEPEIVKMMTDRLYTTGIVESARLHSQPVDKEHVFLYRFSYTGEHTFSEHIFGASLNVDATIWNEKKLDISSFGPPVGDDFLVYIANQYKLTTIEDRNLQAYMTRMFVTFCLYEKPAVPITWLDQFERAKFRNEIPVMRHVNYHPYGTYFNKTKMYTILSRHVTYNHIMKYDEYQTKRSNNLGQGRYWRRAPILFPNIGFKYRWWQHLHYPEWNSNINPFDDV